MSKLSENLWFRRFRALINRHLGPSSLPGEGIQYWRERIFHYFSLAVIFFGVALYLYYGLFFLLAGEYVFLVFLTAIFISSMLVLSLRKIPLKFKVGWVLFMLYLTGAFLLFSGPHTNIAMLFLFACSIMAVTMSGALTGIWYTIVHIITLFAAGFYWHSGYFMHLDPPDISLHTYINISILFVVLNIVTLAPLMSLLNGLMFSIKKELRYQRILHGEQADLVRARQKAEESDKLKSAFLSNMSHEIRTPMNAILGFSNLLANKTISGNEKLEFIDLIRHNANNLMSLVEDIIEISKIESGQFEIRNAPCHLNSLLNEVKEVFEEELFRRGTNSVKIYLKEGLSDTKLQILTDGERLKKVLSNLVGNAIKFTDKGYVEFGYDLNSKNELQFHVTDTGIGLPEGSEDLIFNRFYKCSNNDDKLYGGTGIGLTIAKHLVRYLGGEIWVAPKASVGTTFCFTIPFQKIVAPTSEKIKLWPSDSINWEDKIFLIAEDEEDNFRYLEVVLSLFNAQIIWARDGREAVDIVSKRDDIDLILMDIKMPKMDGYSATKNIRKISPRIPIIAQTAYAMPEEKAKAMQAGCNKYITKPINYNDLIELISHYAASKKEVLR